MSDYTQGIAADGAAILKDGEPMTVEEILTELRYVPQFMVGKQFLLGQKSAKRAGRPLAAGSCVQVIAFGDDWIVFRRAGNAIAMDFADLEERQAFIAGVSQ